MSGEVRNAIANRVDPLQTQIALSWKAEMNNILNPFSAAIPFWRQNYL